MSGPKVVRIVTREEIEAICRRQMAAVEVAAGELRARAERYGTLDGALEAKLAAQTRRFAEMFSQRKWMDIQKQAPEAVIFLQSEGDRLQATMVAAAAAARSRGRRLADAARTIAAELQASGVQAPAELRTVMSSAGSESPAVLDQMERHVSAALKLIRSAKPDPAAAKAGQELAARLGADGQRLTVAEWMASRTAEPTASERRLDDLLAELGALGGAEASVFSDRAKGIVQEPGSSRRALLTDSLVMDVSAHVGRLRTQESALSRLRQAAASVVDLSSPAAQSLMGRIRLALAERSAEHVEALAAETAALVEAEDKVAAAAARRRAILGGLASLGYEVRESMETAWAQDGRIVVRRPGTSDYGVELGAPADVSRLQVRLVGSDHPEAARNARRDADQEAIWCTDFDKLKAGLAQDGGSLVIERALEPGAQAVKTVAMPGAVVADMVEGRRVPRSRASS